MHLLFIHKNFPAQFGQIASHLVRHHGFECTCVSERDLPPMDDIRHLRYKIHGGATEANHYCTRTFENQVWHSSAVYELLKSKPEIRPDLIVCHSGFVSSLFLRELYPGVPHIGYFELFYHARGGDMDFRKDLMLPPERDFLRARNRNAQLLLDLEHCDAGYSPTEFQRSTLPAAFRDKVRTIFDGINTEFWTHEKRCVDGDRVFGDIAVPNGHRLVTYVSRGFESMRGFDIFLRAAVAVRRQRNDVTFIVVGEDKIAYGGDKRFTDGKTFLQWTVEKYQLDLDGIHFPGRLSPSELSQLLASSDLHLYLTVPFVLSWSLMNAMSCGCPVLVSDTAPVRELVSDQQTGLLTDFFDVDAWSRRILEVVDDPESFRHLGDAARTRIEESYSLPICLEKMRKLYDETLASAPS